MSGWANSDRRSRLPKDWHRRRAIAKREAGGICQWVTNGTRCAEVGTDCDHINRLGGDEPANLQWLCREHHARKTIAERPKMPSNKREPEKHPGFL